MKIKQDKIKETETNNEVSFVEIILNNMAIPNRDHAFLAV